MDEKPLARVHHTHHQYMPRKKWDHVSGCVLRKVSLGMDRARIILSIGQSTLNEENNTTHTDSTDTHKRAGAHTPRIRGEAAVVVVVVAPPIQPACRQTMIRAPAFRSRPNRRLAGKL